MYSAFPTSAAFVPPSPHHHLHSNQMPPVVVAPVATAMNGAQLSNTATLVVGVSSPKQPPRQQQQQALNVKAFFNDEIRRITLPEPSWGCLTQRLAELFQFSPEAFLVKWKDDEGDYITLDSDEELAQALRYTDDEQQLLRLYIISRDDTWVDHPPTLNGSHRSPDGMGLQLPLAAGHFTSFFTHATPYSSFAAAVTACPSRGLVPASPTVGSNASTDAVANGASVTDSTQQMPSSTVPPPDSLSTSTLISTAAAAMYAKKREFKEQWKSEKRAIKEQKHLYCNKEEWKSLKKEQEKALKHQKELAKTSHKLMMMERDFDPQDPKDQLKLSKLQQKQCKAAARALYARFVKHVSIPDGTEMGPDTPFAKTWRFRNEGSMAWPQEVTLMFISKINGDQMGAPEFVPVNKVVMPGEEVDVSVNMVSPSRAGHYQAYFRLCYGPKKFGQRVWIKINVVCASDTEGDDENSSESAREVDNLVNDNTSSVVSPIPNPSNPMGELLQKLCDLGFHDSDLNESLLIEHAGSMDSVINVLLN